MHTQLYWLMAGVGIAALVIIILSDIVVASVSWLESHGYITFTHDQEV
jgi:hypothetical protein